MSNTDSCFYCDRTGQQLMPCCDHHPDNLVCADVAGCRDFILASLKATAADAETGYKVRENRVRRMADRQGLQLVKSRRRDPRAIGYGHYLLIDAGAPVTDLDDYTLDLDAAERLLSAIITVDDVLGYDPDNRRIPTGPGSTAS